MNANTARTPARQVLRRRSKSFFWAGLMLPRPMLDDAAVLYAFCRLADDLADDHGESPQQASKLLGQLAAELEAGRSQRPEVRDFLNLCSRRGMDLAAPLALVRTLAEDTGPRRLGGMDEVLRFAHGAAGTVGLMMCSVMGVTDSKALPFAVDLGIAMQLTNIARDVHEDAGRGRVYLPAAEGRAELTPEALLAGDPKARGSAWQAVLEMLATAGRFYRSADHGMRFIPRRPRLAIMTASRLYEAIGERVLGFGGYTAERAVVPKAQKARLTMAAARDWLVNPRFAQRHETRHDPALHYALAGLPGADHEA